MGRWGRNDFLLALDGDTDRFRWRARKSVWGPLMDEPALCRWVNERYVCMHVCVCNFDACQAHIRRLAD